MSIPIGNLTLNLHMKYFIVYVTRNAKIRLKCLRAWCIESLQRLEVIYKGFPYSFLFTQIKFKYTNMCNISKCFSIHFLNIFGEHFLYKIGILQNHVNFISFQIVLYHIMSSIFLCCAIFRTSHLQTKLTRNQIWLLGNVTPFADLNMYTWVLETASTY